MRPPTQDEYAPYYAGYVSQVPSGDIFQIFRDQQDHIANLAESIAEDRAGYRYAEGKWSIAEVLGHVIDTERVFGYRALHFARGAAGAIPGMDQDEFADAAPYAQRTLSSIGAEWRFLRGANVLQFEALETPAFDRTGIASGVEFTVRALLYIMAGHAAHHVTVLQERYL